MSAAHTPGPWTVREDGEANFFTITHKGGEWLCRVQHNGEPRTDVIDANARLVAAAPDLLEAGAAQTSILRNAQEILTRYLIPDGITQKDAISELLGLLDGPYQRQAQEEWDSALAKAAGSAA